MTDSVSFDFLIKAGKDSPPSGKADPRLIALVRFLARRAAERDYEDLLANEAAGKKNKETKDI